MKTKIFTLILAFFAGCFVLSWGTATNYHEFIAEGDTIIDLEGNGSTTELSDKFAAVNNTDWASVSTSNKSASVNRIDPITGEVATSKTSLYGTRLNSTNKSVFKITGVTNVYFYIGSGTSGRIGYLDVASADGTINIPQAATSTLQSGTTDIISYALNKDTSYTLTLYASGDIFCYAVKFTVAHKCTEPENPLTLSSDANSKVYAGNVITFSANGGNGEPITIAGNAGETMNDNTWIAVKGIHTFVASQDSVNGYCEGYSELSYNVAASTPVPSAAIEGKASSLVGKTIVLTCVAEDATDYQWYKNGVAIDGATESTYAFTPDAEGNFVFTCEASNEFNITPVLSNEHRVSVINDTQVVTITAKPDRSALHMAIGDANMANVKNLTINGTINSYDLMIMRNKMINLRELDLTNASIEANPYEYYTGYCSHKDTLLANSFVNLTSLKLPLTLKYVSNVSASDYLEINGGVAGSSLYARRVVINERVTDIMSSAFQNSSLEEIVINAPVAEIHSSSFSGCTSLRSVFLAEGIASIGASAFQGAIMSQLTIPASVKSIGAWAFAPIRDGYDLKLAPNYYSGDKIKNDSGNGNTFFGSGHSLVKLRFAEGSLLERIGDHAFMNCPLDTLIIPDNVYSIGENAFAYCTYLKYIYLPDNPNFKQIADGAFQQCCAITYIHLPAYLETIGKLCFSVKTKKNDSREPDIAVSGNLNLILPPHIQKIDKGAFHGRQSNLTGITFPNRLTTIERDAFMYCTGLQSISFPTSLQTIGDYAFQGCSGLKEIRVPSTLLEIGNYAFSNCGAVTKVYTYTVEPVSIDQNTFSCWGTADLYVPTTSYYTYYYNTQWSQFLSLKEFDEPYTYFYINNDYELDDNTGAVDGQPDVDLNPGSGLIVSGDEIEQNTGTVVVNSDEGNGTASIIACDDNLIIDSLVVRLLARKNHWCYFCFPFDVSIDQLSFPHQFVIREYDGDIRAKHGAGGWQNFEGDTLRKGMGYIFQGAQTDTLVISIQNPTLTCTDYAHTIFAYSSGNSLNSNWNFIGNPYPSWFDLDGLYDMGYTSPIYIWNGDDYQVYRPGDDEYHFHPFEGFFTQNPEASTIQIVWESEGRETKTQTDQKKNNYHMPARKAMRRARQVANHRQLINIELASDNYTERTRIVFNNAASTDYELGKDAVFMDGGGAPLHIWSIDGDNNRLSINERPYSTGQIDLGYYVKEDGFYTLSVSRMDTAVIIYDNELQQEVDLSAGDYVFNTGAGTNNTRFSIIRATGNEDGTTDIGEISPDEMVNVYTILGVKILENVRRGDLHLGTGVYVVENNNGARTEMTIK